MNALETGVAVSVLAGVEEMFCNVVSRVAVVNRIAVAVKLTVPEIICVAGVAVGWN